MDPNAALEEFRSAYSHWEDTRGRGENLDNAVASADRMRDAMWALDEWLSKGGYLPTAWERLGYPSAD